MDGHEPKMRKSGLQDVVQIRGGTPLIEPVEKGLHLSVEPVCCRCFEMDTLVPNWTRDNLHWAGAVVAPAAHAHLPHTAATRGKQRCMPSEQAITRERFVVVS